MMHGIQRTDHRTPGWLVVATFAALLIVGLLGMHTLSSAHSPPDLGTETTHAMTADAGHAHETSTPAGTGLESECSDCATDGQHVMAMACVLGLLATLLLICRARPGLVRVNGTSIVDAVLRPAVVRLRPPPSLNLLSISRT
ncbi:DUF6153 family protein [Microbacterium sulfonylureivorans]|uniref:DUF6153 family protein n=1 Tax=Microbacterium sulfonylureivorans TaxID=2486854 RepID=UPI000FD8CBC4|nr:DUF6153 family protein [Microbacterium sulfonylureivorans]